MTHQFFVMPDDDMETLVTPLTTARRTIEIYVFTLGNKAVLQALSDAVNRGVAVRAIVEKQPNNNEQAGKANHKALKDAGVDAHTTPSYFDRVHAKSYVVDDTIALISSINYLEDWRNTRDYGLVTDDPSVVGTVKATFEADWREHKHQLQQVPPAPVVLSPNNSRQVISELIRSAQTSLMVEQEQITDPEILEAIAERANAGVDVRVIANPAQTKNLAPLAQLAAQAPTARVLYTTKLWLHAKIVIADSSRMLMGSLNLIEVSLDKRREVSVILTDRATLERAEATFQQDRSTSSPVVPADADQPLRPSDSPAQQHDS